MMKLRLFTALLPEHRLLEDIISLQNACRRSGMQNLRYIEVENLHVTVNFLGDTDPMELPALHDILQQGVSMLKAPVFKPAGMGVFPSFRRARSLNLLLEDPEGGMDLMFRHLDGLLKGAGYPGEDRRFRPHVTFGRFRSPRGETVDADMLPSLTGDMERIFRVRELVLFRSELGPGGARYSPEGRYRFGTE
ncbi:RNA 2',3'-cyclic phosphodiesterase [Marispirochaeta sp.]|jgi:RNA 2',3'-cyclic 3'-phosphodiesterase|uniref:RNA 2',3'-cyclic phosphodiesterase n=1 Tax=Marispirochaeta sp. TaxID=2038653 RepID=UPI0029C8C599|nr:RNA 2',3'-cyclic phosphodiesterase [Marispirochaeta sp.]